MLQKIMGPLNRMQNLSAIQLSVLAILRIAIGWHFLYEGIVKLLNPGWTSAAYLAESKWLFFGIFNWIVTHPEMLKIVDKYLGTDLNRPGIIFRML